jgi:hypothetical protein
MIAAANCPLVSLFGPTPPEKFAPLAARARVLRAQDFAQGFAGSFEGIYGDDDMASIPLAAVAAAVDDLLGTARGSTAAEARLDGESRHIGREAR